MKNNIDKKLISTVTLAMIAAISGCSSESTGSSEEYITEEACLNYTPPPSGISTVFTNDPIIDAEGLSSGISFDDAMRLTGAVPIPTSTAGVLNFANVAVTDKSIQSLFISGEVPVGKRIGAVFVALDGVNEYFTVPIARGQETGSADELPLKITLRGPFPIEGTEPEPDIIQAQIVNDLTVFALLVDAAADTPDLTGDLTALLADGTNWLAPASVPTITAENVGGGGMQITLFWDQAVDLDLWLIEPDGHKIYYVEKASTAGDGFLDFDDIDGFGPENIFYMTDIPSGDYQVQVDYFSGSEITNWSVSVSACGSTVALSGRLEEAGDLDSVYSFTHGPDCELVIPVVADPRSRPSVFDEAVLCDSQ